MSNNKNLDGYDLNNVYLDIEACSYHGNSQIFAKKLLLMYEKYCNKNNLRATLLYKNPGEKYGIESATIAINGYNVYELLKYEIGTHVCISESLNHLLDDKRYTAYASVHVSPINNGITISINDIEANFIDNIIPKKIIIRHLRSGTQIESINYYSSRRNLTLFIEYVCAKLYPPLRRKDANRIRNYNFFESCVTDYRSGVRTNDIQSVLDGNLDQFIK